MRGLTGWIAVGGSVAAALFIANCASEEPTQIIVRVDTTPAECALIQKTPQTVSVEVERKSSRVKTGRLAHPLDNSLAQAFEVAIAELDLRELVLVALEPIRTP